MGGEDDLLLHITLSVEADVLVPGLLTTIRAVLLVNTVLPNCASSGYFLVSEEAEAAKDKNERLDLGVHL